MNEDQLAQRITDDDIDLLATEYGIEWAAIKTIIDIESNGKPFYKTGEPVILFEGHIFSRLTKGKFDSKYPTISHPKATTKYYGLKQLDRLELALDLQPEAALMSASWGAMQVMGFNYEMVGYDSVFDYVKHMFISEFFHIKAGLEYIRNAGLIPAIKKKNWAALASGYNGKNYAINQYDVKLEKRYAHWFPIGEQRKIDQGKAKLLITTTIPT